MALPALAPQEGYPFLLFLAAIGILVRFRSYEVLGNVQMAMIFGIAPALLIRVLFVPWLEKIFELKSLVYLGKISLAIYLWHFPVQYLWKTIDVYGNLKINFSRKHIWIIYVLSVLITAVIYEKLLSKRLTKTTRIFIRSCSPSDT